MELSLDNSSFTIAVVPLVHVQNLLDVRLLKEIFCCHNCTARLSKWRWRDYTDKRIFIVESLKTSMCPELRTSHFQIVLFCSLSLHLNRKRDFCLAVVFNRKKESFKLLLLFFFISRFRFSYIPFNIIILLTFFCSRLSSIIISNISTRFELIVVGIAASINRIFHLRL